MLKSLALPPGKPHLTLNSMGPEARHWISLSLFLVGRDHQTEQ